MIGLVDGNCVMNLNFLAPRGNPDRQYGVFRVEIFCKRALDGAPPLRKIHWFKIRRKSAEWILTVRTKQAGG